LDLHSFTLLSEGDLKDLGFLMGPRKKVVQWMKGIQIIGNGYSIDVPAVTPAGVIAADSSGSLPLLSSTFLNCSMIPAEAVHVRFYIYLIYIYTYIYTKFASLLYF
jgi:hypothetical protein